MKLLNFPHMQSLPSQSAAQKSRTRRVALATGVFVALACPLLATCARRPDDGGRARQSVLEETRPAIEQQAAATEAPENLNASTTAAPAERARTSVSGAGHAVRKAIMRETNGGAIKGDDVATPLKDTVTSENGEAPGASNLSSDDAASPDADLGIAPTTPPGSDGQPDEAPETESDKFDNPEWYVTALSLARYALWGLLLLLLTALLIRKAKRQQTRLVRRPQETPLILAVLDEASPKQAPDSQPPARIDSPSYQPPSGLSWSLAQPAYNAWEGWHFSNQVDVSPRTPAPLPVPVHTEESAPAWNAPEVFAPPITVTEAEDCGAASSEPSAPEVIADPMPMTDIQIEDASPPALLGQLEQIATIAGEPLPAFFVELDSPLPVLVFSAPPTESLLDQLETLTLEAMQEREPSAAWLLVQLLMQRITQASKTELNALYTQASALVRHGAADASDDNRARWLARSIDLELAHLARQKGATRLLSLRTTQARHAADIEAGEGPVLRAWIDVLLYWAHCQIGDGALDKYAEAEAICQRLLDISKYANEAQRLHAKLLVQRASVEQGGVRANSLEAAQSLIDELFAREPTAETALAVATTALARGQVLPPEPAKEAYSHALMHAFLADSHPRWRADSLQCRLAIQLAYEALPDMPVQGRVALDLTSRLEAMPAAQAETLHHMAQTYLRHADFARACQLCTEAWRSGTPASVLMSTWQEASRQWAAALPQSTQDKTWQASERLRRNAAHGH